MATFERRSSQPHDAENQQQYQKYTLRRLEPAIQKFLKVIQIDLARLHRHRLNVERFNRLKDWASLHTEHINATRTVQQIKANIHEIEKSRLQVRDEDLEMFDNKINDMKHSAIKSVKEFVDVASEKTRDTKDHSSSDNSPSDDLEPLLTLKGQLGSGPLDHDQLQLNELPENTEVAESWDNLQENLEELNSLVHQFANLVDDQQETLDRIEDNVEQAQSSVHEGTKQLGKAAKYKAAILPIAGAVIGTVVAGPVGMFAGAKIGGVIGVIGGGAAGFLSGKFLKKRQNQVTEIHLSNLSRSNSLPDIHEPAVPCEDTSWFSWGRKRNQSTGTVEISNKEIDGFHDVQNDISKT